MKNYLNFETDIKNLESELEQLKDPYNQEGLSEVNTDKILQLQNSIDSKLKEITGILNLSASFINLITFLYPSGLIIPKFLSILDSKLSPFS